MGYARPGIWGGTWHDGYASSSAKVERRNEGFFASSSRARASTWSARPRSSADLSGVIEAQRPDVVVLDDGIGVMAVSMVHEVAPDAKVVLVWPSSVVPIGGDARVEPAKILQDLGPAVEHVAERPRGSPAFERPEWIDAGPQGPRHAAGRSFCRHRGAAAAATNARA